MDGADRRRAAPAIHAARLARPWAIRRRLLPARHEPARIRIARTFQPRLFPQAARHHTARAIRPVARVSAPEKSLVLDQSRLPLTTNALAGDYLVLCRNPLKDLNDGSFESGKKHKGRSPFRPTNWRSSHAQNPSPRLASRSHRISRRPVVCNVAAGWTRQGENGAKVILCPLDREPVLTTMTACDRYESKEELQHLFDQMARHTTKK